MGNTPPGSEFHGTTAWLGGLQDIWMLGQADDVLLTPWSSFSSYAAALGDTAPWELEGNMAILTGLCHKVSNEPCAMRNWGPLPDSCPPGQKKPVKLPKGLDRRCGYDHANGYVQDGRWRGPRIEGMHSQKRRLNDAWANRSRY